MKRFFLLYYLALSVMLWPSDITCNPSKLTIAVAPVTSLGSLIIINPITAILGAATQLATIAQNALQKYMEQNSPLSHNIPLPPEVILAERSYYEQRIVALEALKQEFLSLKKDLEAFRFLKGTNQTTFTYEFLNHINQLDPHHKDPLLHISRQREKYLTDNQKENLRLLRETQLQRIGQEITSLQTSLVVHIYVLMEQVSVAYDEYHVFQEKIEGDIKLWNKNINNITYNTALQLYRTELQQAYLLNSLKQKVDELQMIAHYYRNNVNISCIEKSTNIIPILETLDPLITDLNLFIPNQKTVNDNNIRITEQHFIAQGINIQQIRNDIKKNLEQNRNNRAKQTIAQAKNKLENIVVAGGPSKDPKDNDRNKERIFNAISKTEFFKKVEEHYEYYKDNIYKRKRGTDGIEDAEYLKWDKLHNDVEAYGKNKCHIGSIDPKTLRIYKGPKHAKLKI